MGKPGVFKRINGADKTITPFKAYKSWRYATTSSLSSDGLDRLVAIKPNPEKFSGNRVTLDTWQTEFDSGSILINTYNDKEASLVWYSLNHLYYKRAGKPFETFGYSDPYAIERTIFDEASIISIPQKKFGEGIKPGSVKLHLKNSALNAVTMSLIDDGKGNLIDTELSGSISHELLYLGFNSMTYERNWTENVNEVSLELNSLDKVYADTTIQDLDIRSKNVWITPKYSLPTGSLNIDWGNAAYFNGNSYIRIPNNPSLNFKQSEDYAVAFWIYREGLSSGHVISKRTTGTGDWTSAGLVHTGDVNYNAAQYPFNISLTSGTSNSLVTTISDGATTRTMSYSMAADARHHVLLQKTGSVAELYIDGQLVNSTAMPNQKIQNKADIFIGSLGLTNSGVANDPFTGAIDEFFLFSKALTEAEVNQLSNVETKNIMCTNTNAVGNVFYEHGIIVLSDPRPKYGTPTYRMFNDVLYNYKTGLTQAPYLSEFLLEYNSTVTLYEHEYVCKIKEDEFNFTTNATIRLDNEENSPIPKSITQNNDFAPYLTTVGLYTAAGELVAVGKLGTPIKKRNDVDLNIIVRFDV